MTFMKSYNPYSVANAYRAAGGAYVAKSLMGRPVYVGQGQKFGYGRTPTRTMTKTKRRRGSGAGSSLTTAIRNMETAQHYSQYAQLTVGSNGQYALNPIGAIVLGNSNRTRSNDEIFIECLKINYSYETVAAVSGGQKFRIIVVWHDDEATASPNWVQNSLDGANLFLLNTATINYSDGIIDPKRTTVISDTTICVNASFASMSERSCGDYTVQIKKPFVFKPTQAYGKLKNLYVYVCGDANGVADGVPMALFNFSYDLIYKNSK